MAVDDGLRPLFRSKLPSIFWTTIETGGTGAGVPDSHFICAGGRSGWIEFKATKAWAIRLHPEQVGWLSRYVRYGGTAYVVTRRRTFGGPKSGPPCDTLWIHNAIHAPLLKSGGLRNAPAIATMDGGPSRWDWSEVLRILNGGR